MNWDFVEVRGPRKMENLSRLCHSAANRRYSTIDDDDDDDDGDDVILY